MNRISDLPQTILHDILSRLPDKDAGRTSVLSKAWQDTWSTFPFLVFDESRYHMTEMPEELDDPEDFQQMEKFMRDKHKFCNLVNSTLLRFQDKGLAIRKFKLALKSFTPRDLLSLVGHWMKLACESGVEVLHLENLRYSDSHDEFECLPLSVLEAKSLIKLHLAWDFRVDIAFLNHPIKFSSLQVLSLSHVYLGDGRVIQNLISSCPLIEDITLDECSGLKSVSIHGLPKLKMVTIMRIEEIDVDAPSLENLFYSGAGFIVPCKINIDNCRNLRELSLVSVRAITITDQWFLELFQKFPLLENLVLEGFCISERIKISSVQLKDLELCNCYNFKEAEIDAPNLYKCTYHGDGSIMPVISILNSSRQLVLYLVFFIDYLLDLEMLREFLQNIKPRHIPVSLFLGFADDSTVDFDPVVLQKNPITVPNIKHLTVSVISDTEALCLPLVTGLFWSFRPDTISFNLTSDKTLVKIFCEKLIGGKEDDCCCSSSQIKCWWHFLKDVKVTSSFRKHENAVVDFKTLLEALPTLSSEEEEEISLFLEQDISFRLEWQLYS